MEKKILNFDSPNEEQKKPLKPRVAKTVAPKKETNLLKTEFKSDNKKMQKLKELRVAIQKQMLNNLT